MRTPHLLAGLLATLSAHGTALAQPATPGEPPRLVALVLRADEPDLRVELSPDAEDPRPLAACRAPCRVLVPPGDYLVRVSGHDPDIEGDFSWLSVEGDADVLVRTPRESQKKRGKRAGFAGVAVFAGGLSVTALGLCVTMLLNALGSTGSIDLDLYGDEEDDGYDSTEDEPDPDTWVSPLVPIGLGVTVLGGAIAAVGWRGYARNTGPGLRSLPSAHSRAVTARTRWIVAPSRVGQGFGVVAGARF